MKFIKKHHLLIINLSIIIVLISIVVSVKILFSETKKNFTEIKDYSQGLLENDNDISFTNVVGDNFELKINGKTFHKGNTLKSFYDKLKEIEENNSTKKIFVNIYNDDDLVKTEIYKYSDFGYIININGILLQVKNGIVGSKKTLNINLKDYIFFDNKLLNKKIDKIKSSFTESSNGEIVYSKENKSFDVNSTKVYLTSVKEVKVKASKLDENIVLNDSAIDIYLTQDENVFFKQVENLNDKINQLAKQNYSINGGLDGLDYEEVKKALSKLNIKTLSLTKDGKNFKIVFPKGFIVNFIAYNKEINSIDFDEKSFDALYGDLSKLIIANKSDEIKENASLFSIVSGGISENKPIENHFNVLSYGDGVIFDYLGFKKEIKIYLNKVMSEEIDNININTDSLFVLKTSNKSSQNIVIENHDSTLADKKIYTLNQGLYRNGDYITEKYINYGKYPFVLNNNSGYHTCSLSDNIKLYCEEGEIFMGNLGYNGKSIILKEPDKTLFELASVDNGLSKKNGNIYFEKDIVTLYYGTSYNNISFSNKTSQIIKDYKEELFPSILWDNIVGNIEYDKVVFRFKSGNTSNALLIKSNTGLQNNYLYLFNISLSKNE